MKQDVTITRNTFHGIHYTTKHTGKMKGIISLSTDINTNPVCQGRQKLTGSICSKCYAENMMDDAKGIYRRVNESFKRNAEILRTRLLKDCEIPALDPVKFPLFRFSAFDDVANITQVLNYLKIARKNPLVRFALWTKNPGFISKAATISPIPANVQIILSSMGINKPAHGERFQFVSKVFTVYDKETIKKDGVEINCGARSCYGCRLCYMPNPVGG